MLRTGALVIPGDISGLYLTLALASMSEARVENPPVPNEEAPRLNARRGPAPVYFSATPAVSDDAVKRTRKAADRTGRKAAKRFRRALRANTTH